MDIISPDYTAGNLQGVNSPTATHEVAEWIRTHSSGLKFLLFPLWSASLKRSCLQPRGVSGSSAAPRSRTSSSRRFSQTPGKPPPGPSALGHPLPFSRPLLSSPHYTSTTRGEAPSQQVPARPGRLGAWGGERDPAWPGPRLPRPRSAPLSGLWARAGRESARAPRGPRGRGAPGRWAPPGTGR